MPLLALADIHTEYKAIKWVEARRGKFQGYLLAGDIIDTAKPDLPRQRDLASKWLESLATQPDVFVAVCSGNHDLDAIDKDENTTAQWVRKLQAPNIIKDCEVQSLEIDGVRFAIGCAPENYASSALLEQEIENTLVQLHQTDATWRILLHHAPPNAPLIATTKVNAKPSLTLGRLLRQYPVELVISGHVHSAPFSNNGHWWDKIDQVTCLNAGQNQSGPFPAYIELFPALNKMELAWHAFNPYRRRAVKDTHVINPLR